jgi:hypothetical protein
VMSLPPETLQLGASFQAPNMPSASRRYHSFSAIDRHGFGPPTYLQKPSYRGSMPKPTLFHSCHPNPMWVYWSTTRLPWGRAGRRTQREMLAVSSSQRSVDSERTVIRTED